jgi:putative nucleotidyltransferase with HDIG domain
MTTHQMLAKVRDLPPISTAALQLVSLLDKPEASNEDIIRVLRQDSVLTAKLLRVCNSSALALKEQVTSVDQAVLLLGYAQIFRTVMAIALRGPLSVPMPAPTPENANLWRHCLLAATAAEMLVGDGMDFGVDSSTAFTAGLLHDIGKLITNQFLTEEYSGAMQRRIAEGMPPVQAEREVWGTDHAEVGTGLMYLWRLPEAIVEAVARHHQPVLKPRPRLSALACFANCIAHQADLQLLRNPGSENMDDLCVALDFNPKATEEFVKRVQQSVEATDSASAF